MKQAKIVASAAALAALIALAAGCVIEIVDTDHHDRDSYWLHSEQRSYRCASCHPTVVRVDTGASCWACH